MKLNPTSFSGLWTNSWFNFQLTPNCLFTNRSIIDERLNPGTGNEIAQIEFVLILVVSLDEKLVVFRRTLNLMVGAYFSGSLACLTSGTVQVFDDIKLHTLAEPLLRMIHVGLDE